MLSVYTNNFRCFRGEQTVPLRPLTLLVGENSTGKTSFLAAVRLAEKMRALREPPDFNEEPFKLGAFLELSHRQSGKVGQSEDFAIGSTFHVKHPRIDESGVTQTITFTNVAGQPAMQRLEYKTKRDSIALERKDSSTLVSELSIDGSPVSTSEHATKIADLFLAYRFNLSEVFHDHYVIGRAHQILDSLWDLVDVPSYHEPYATAPIRAKPERTYDLLNDTTRPEGDHIPMILSRIYGQAEWETLKKPLEQFAKASGLFEAISVKRLGKHEGSPFQIHIKISGQVRNLMDVGYGVSQALPLIIDLLRDHNRRLFLIQQPEVHLHPRAQAELGSFFASIVHSQNKQILVETHSDYLIDRVRTSVRGKSIDPSEVLLLYFQRDAKGVTIHPMEMDDQGNYLTVPTNFGSFFLQEERRNLGF